jgi:hypothetical protein
MQRDTRRLTTPPTRDIPQPRRVRMTGEQLEVYRTSGSQRLGYWWASLLTMALLRPPSTAAPPNAHPSAARVPSHKARAPPIIRSAPASPVNSPPVFEPGPSEGLNGVPPRQGSPTRVNAGRRRPQPLCASRAHPKASMAYHPGRSRPSVHKHGQTPSPLPVCESGPPAGLSGAPPRQDLARPQHNRAGAVHPAGCVRHS